MGAHSSKPKADRSSSPRDVPDEPPSRKSMLPKNILAAGDGQFVYNMPLEILAELFMHSDSDTVIAFASTCHPLKRALARSLKLAREAFQRDTPWIQRESNAQIVFAQAEGKNAITSDKLDDALKRVWVAIGGGPIVGVVDASEMSKEAAQKELQQAIRSDGSPKEPEANPQSALPERTQGSAYTAAEAEAFLGCHTRLNLWSSVGSLGVASFLLMRENPSSAIWWQILVREWKTLPVRYPLLTICNLVALKLLDSLSTDPEIVYLLSYQQLFARVLWTFHLKFLPLLPLLVEPHATDDVAFSLDAVQHVALNSAYNAEGMACVWLRPRIFDPAIERPLPDWLHGYQHDRSAINLLNSTSHAPFFAAEVTCSVEHNASSSSFNARLHVQPQVPQASAFILINKKEFHVYHQHQVRDANNLSHTRFEFKHFTVTLYNADQLHLTRRSKSEHPHGHLKKEKKIDLRLTFRDPRELARIASVLAKMKRFMSSEDYHTAGF